MACASSIRIPGSSICRQSKDHTVHSPLCRSHSARDLFRKNMMRRSSSDNNLCYAINRARATSSSRKLKHSHSVGILHIPGAVKSFLFESENRKSDVNTLEYKAEESGEVEKRANWIERLIEMRSRWSNKIPKEHSLAISDGDTDLDECEVDYSDEECEEESGDEGRKDDAFANLLVKVGLSDTKLFSQLAFLSNMAYVIPQMKAKDLRRHYRLRFITSSLEKKEEAAAIKAKLDEDSTRVPIISAPNEPSLEKSVELNKKSLKDPSVAYGIAASAASYAKSRSKGLSSNGYDLQLEEGAKDQKRNIYGLKGAPSTSRVKKSEVAAFVAASTMTAVIAAGENEKMEAAKELQSLQSSPCEWFVCDDYSTYTRCFVIQGSDSLASWHTNLFFEPTKFENSDVLVHRGIYEAAKGIYEQFLPEINDHVQRFGERAKLQFTGHSLGGSLSLLVSLMLISRKAVRPSMLRPAVTFGSPYIFCGGQKLLDELSISESHIHCVVMHRDIVPRAFSCIYPNHVAQLLKQLHVPFRTHPCLNKHKLLYTPLGKTFIIQPDEQSSPPHPLLPRGSAFYYLDKTKSKYAAAALRTFLNSPHPLETLSDPTAYGSQGTILRDHDSSNYLKAMNWVLRQEKRSKMETHHNVDEYITPNVVPPASTQRWIHGGDTSPNKKLPSAEVAMYV
ncbi:unnamed protein product [Rhodiola kirilowii]